MSKLQTPQHSKARSLLRFGGLAALVIGLVVFGIGLVNFFVALSGGGFPKYFWCCFLGLPIIFVGTVMCILGFLGSAARYLAAEEVPVASDAINDLAEGTKDSVKTIARAVAEGLNDASATNKEASQDDSRPDRK